MAGIVDSLGLVDPDEVLPRKKSGSAVDYSPDAVARRKRESTAMKRAQRDAAAYGGAELDEGPDLHRNPPKPDPACLYGFIGEIAQAASATTEANAFAVALNLIAYMSAGIGRGPYLPVGNTFHHCRIFGQHVGRTGRGRKGDAVGIVHRIDMALRRLDEGLAPQVHRGGLSSREGLVMLIHDGYREGKLDIEPIHDKRLWVNESEFANVLAQSKRDGNTLSTALRDVWDGVSLRPATKTNRLWATHPHVALSVAITPGELRGLMASRELTNGFANRFLMIWAERTKVLPFPKATPQDAVDAYAGRLRDILLFAGADRFVEIDTSHMELTKPARDRYATLYTGELDDQTAGDKLTPLLERRAPMLLRLAMLFALTDKTFEIDLQHINTALAWVRYWVESVKYVFSSDVDEAGTEQLNADAEKIVAHLQAHGQTTRKQLTVECFGGHASKAKIDAALDELLAATPPRIVLESVPRPKTTTPGSPTKLYSLAANSANSANCEQRQGLRADRAGANPANHANSRRPRLAPLAQFANWPITRKSLSALRIRTIRRVRVSILNRSRSNEGATHADRCRAHADDRRQSVDRDAGIDADRSASSSDPRPQGRVAHRRPGR